MNKPLVYTGLALGAAALGYFAYRYMQTPTQAYQPGSVSPYSNPYFTTDPYQSYPFTANVAPRVDNSNQPWANNNRSLLAGVSSPQLDVNLTNLNMMADIFKSGSTIIDSGQSIWGNVSSWFSSGDSSSFMGDWTGLDNSMTSWDWGNLA